MRATSLTDEEIGALRERARREAGPFVDPHLVHRIRIHNAEWASGILGFSFTGPEHLIWSDLYLLHIASEVEPSPPPPPVQTAQLIKYRGEEAARRKAEAVAYRQKVDEWNRLKAALEAAGTRVSVRHNYTSTRHLDLYVQGVDHIYLKAPLDFGRLHRDADIVLCWTPSRAKDLEHFPVEGEYDDRVPECRACLKIARSIANQLDSTKEEA